MHAKENVGRYLAPLVLLILLLGLTACGSDRENDSAEAEETKSATTVVRFADVGFKERLYQPLLAAFQEQNPEWRVQFVPVEEAADPLSGDTSALDLASLADVVVLPRRLAPGEDQYFQDLEPRLGDTELDESAYWPGALAACRPDSRQTGVPLYVTPDLIMLNPAVLPAGTTRPAPGWTWADFQTLVTATHESGADRYGFAQSETPAALLGAQIAAQIPAENATLDAVALAAATEWYVELVRAGAVYLASEAEASVEDVIEAGNVATWVDQPIDVGAWRNALGEGITALPFPIGEVTDQTTPMSAACATISGGTKVPDAAWAWLRFLAERPFVMRPWEIPAQQDVATSTGFWDNVDDDLEETYRYALEHAWYGPVTPAIERVAGAIQESFGGEADAASALAALEPLPTATPIPIAAATAVVISGNEGAATAGSAGVIRFFNGSGGIANMTVIREAAERFATETGVQVEFGDFFTLSQLADASPFSSSLLEEVPVYFDCLSWGGVLFDPLASQVLPIEALVADQYPELLGDFELNVLVQAEVDGVLTGIPVALHPLAFYYNAERFERRGIPPLEPGWSVEEFTAVAEQMPLGEGRSQIYGYVPYGDFQGSPYELLLAAFGVLPYDLAAEPIILNLDDPDTIAAVERIAALIEGGVIAPFDSGGTRENADNYHEMEQIVQSGRATIWSEQIGQAEDRLGGFNATSFLFKLANVPDTDVPLPPATTTNLYISAQTENVDACLDWIVYLSGVPDVYKSVPSRLSVRDSATWEAEVGSEEAAILRELAARSTRMAPNYFEVGPILAWWQDALTAVFDGADAAESLTEAQNKAEQYLACVEQAPGELADRVSSCAVEVDPDYPIFTPEPEE